VIYGLNLPNYGTLGTRDALVEIAAHAEALGYARLWTSDHVLLPATLPEPFGHLLETFTTLSYLAASTSSIGLATGVLVLPQREPLLVAKQAATVHHLSGGRLTLGVAVGWIEQEFRFLGADFATRGKLADEYIGAIRELFVNEQPAFRGEHVEFSDALFSPRPAPPIRIVVGGDSLAAIRRAAALGDGWHGIEQTPAQVQASLAAIDRMGRREGFTVSLRTPLTFEATSSSPPVDGALVGSIDTVTKQTQAYADAGVQELVVQPLQRERRAFIDQMTMFATDVMPQITQSGGSR
jgi:probable F420-dependent oxidoreductase